MTVSELGPDITSTREELDNSIKLQRQYTLMELQLTKEQELFIENKLSSKKWRMNNLYTIRDKDNVKRIMRLNTSQQRVLYDFRHNKKVILKSRQQGISTLFLAYYLDSCLFKPGFQAGIQSYGIDEAVKLQKRALLMWEELDDAVKEILGLTLVSSNSRGMTFSNGSVLKIGNFRGDTLQGLHVSELAKIARKYPEKATELATGAFQAIGKSGKITIESTAEGNSGLFYDMWMKSVRRLDTNRITPLDFQPIFLSWVEDPDCYMEEAFEPEEWMLDELAKLNKEAGGNLELTKGQFNWYYAKLFELEDNFNQEYPLTPELAFSQSLEGTYFKHQYDKIIDDGRYGDFPYVAGIKVDVAFDLGVNDEMTMTLGQIVDGVPRIINYYENTRLEIEHYVEILKAMSEKFGYHYGDIFLPHDGKVFEMTSGVTRTQRFRELGFWQARPFPNAISFLDSINGARLLMKYIQIDSHKCEKVLESIQQYSRKYDKAVGVYLARDVHDVHSNRMASFRYLARGWGYRKMSRGPKEVKEVTKKSEMWERFRNKKNTYNDYTIY